MQVPLYSTPRKSQPEHHKPHPKAKFSHEEDVKLRQLIEQYGTRSWEEIASKMEGRNVRQCKERWTNYLSPEIGNYPWTPEEDRLLQQKRNEIGPKWVKIAQFFPNRTDTNVKNRWLVMCRRSKRSMLRSMDSLLGTAQQAGKQTQTQFAAISNPQVPSTSPSQSIHTLPTLETPKSSRLLPSMESFHLAPSVPTMQPISATSARIGRENNPKPMGLTLGLPLFQSNPTFFSPPKQGDRAPLHPFAPIASLLTRPVPAVQMASPDKN